jgi:hypothetical protein
MTATNVQRDHAGARAGSARPGRVRVLAHSLTIARRDLIQIVRSPELLVFSAVQPIMFVLLFNYVFGGAIPGRRAGPGVPGGQPPGRHGQRCRFAPTTANARPSGSRPSGVLFIQEPYQRDY